MIKVDIEREKEQRLFSKLFLLRLAARDTVVGSGPERVICSFLSI